MSVDQKNYAPSKRVPTYRKVEKALRDHIMAGKWGIGTMLPSRQNLASEYNVSLGTVERAVTTLIADGLLSASDRRGTFVSRDSISVPRSIANSEVSSWDGPHVHAHQHSGATLGIIASYNISSVDSKEHLAYWMRQTAHALTSAYLKPDEVSVFHNMHRERDEEPESILDAVRELTDQGVSAIAILDLHNIVAPNELNRLASSPNLMATPLVYVSGTDIDAAIPHVCYDSAYTGRQAVLYCTQRGFRSVLFVSAVRSDWNLDRFESAKSAAMRAGMAAEDFQGYWLEPPLSGKTDTGTDQRMAGQECGRAIFRQSEIPRCIIANNDYVAYGIMDAAKELHLTAGKDFALIGFDDAPYSLPYGLTTFRPPLEELGVEAARMLRRIESGDSAAVQVTLRWNLVVRSSSQYRNYLK